MAGAELWATYPGVELPARFLRPAFEDYWSHTGWQEVDIDLTAVSNALGVPVASVSELSVEQVLEWRKPPKDTRPADTDPAVTPPPPAASDDDQPERSRQTRRAAPNPKE